MPKLISILGIINFLLSFVYLNLGLYLVKSKNEPGFFNEPTSFAFVVFFNLFKAIEPTLPAFIQGLNVEIAIKSLFISSSLFVNLIISSI